MTPERIKQERAKFEAWMTAQNPANSQIERVGNEYSRLGTQYKFEGWLARAAQSEWISVEARLPESDPELMPKDAIGTNRKYFVYPKGMEIHKPLRTPPEKNDWVYVVRDSDSEPPFVATGIYYDGSPLREWYLVNGLMHKKPEATREHANVLNTICRGATD